MINNTTGQQIPATVIATRGREVVAKNASDQLFRRNRAQVSGRGDHLSTESGEVQASLEKVWENSEGVQTSPSQTEEPERVIVQDDQEVQVRRKESETTSNQGKEDLLTRTETEETSRKSPMGRPRKRTSDTTKKQPASPRPNYVTRAGRQSRPPRKFDL